MKVDHNCLSLERLGRRLDSPRLELPGEREIHVWRAQPSSESYPVCFEQLSNTERDRADRFVFTEDRVRFAVTRAILRTLLGQYLGISPESICLTYGPFGKPVLESQPSETGINFSVSHSGDCTLLAFAVGHAVGVDVEDLIINRDVDQLAKLILSDERYRKFRCLTETGRKRELLKNWTQREAIDKALGTGVQSVTQSRQSSVCSASQWTVLDVDAGEGYVAAVAVEQPCFVATLKRWDNSCL